MEMVRCDRNLPPKNVTKWILWLSVSPIQSNFGITLGRITMAVKNVEMFFLFHSQKGRKTLEAVRKKNFKKTIKEGYLFKVAVCLFVGVCVCVSETLFILEYLDLWGPFYLEKNCAET